MNQHQLFIVFLSSSLSCLTMAPIPQTLEVIEQGSGRPAFKEAMGIVLKLLGNIIKEPANTKYDFAGVVGLLILEERI